MSNFKEVACPFCGESDFDLFGLQIHLQNGWCAVYGSLTDHARIEALNEQENVSNESV